MSDINVELVDFKKWKSCSIGSTDSPVLRTFNCFHSTFWVIIYLYCESSVLQHLTESGQKVKLWTLWDSYAFKCCSKHDMLWIMSLSFSMCSFRHSGIHYSWFHLSKESRFRAEQTFQQSLICVFITCVLTPWYIFTFLTVSLDCSFLSLVKKPLLKSMIIYFSYPGLPGCCWAHQCVFLLFTNLLNYWFDHS